MKPGFSLRVLAPVVHLLESAMGHVLFGSERHVVQNGPVSCGSACNTDFLARSNVPVFSCGLNNLRSSVLMPIKLFKNASFNLLRYLL